MKNLFASLAILTLAPLSVLRADQVTYEQHVRRAPLATLTTITLPGFDRQLGELQQVQLEFVAQFSATVGIDNQDRTAKLVHIDADACTTLRTRHRTLLASGRDKAEAELVLAPRTGPLFHHGPWGALLDIGIGFHQSATVKAGFGDYLVKELVMLAGMRGGVEIVAEGVVSAVHHASADYRVRITYVYVPASGGPKTPQELDPTAEISPKDALRPSPSLEVEKA